MTTAMILGFCLHATGSLFILLLSAVLLRALLVAGMRRSGLWRRRNGLRAAMRIPALRYARGEIDEAVYRQMTEDLKALA